MLQVLGHRIRLSLSLVAAQRLQDTRGLLEAMGQATGAEGEAGARGGGDGVLPLCTGGHGVLPLGTGGDGLLRAHSIPLLSGVPAPQGLPHNPDASCPHGLIALPCARCLHPCTGPDAQPRWHSSQGDNMSWCPCTPPAPSHAPCRMPATCHHQIPMPPPACHHAIIPSSCHWHHGHQGHHRHQGCHQGCHQGSCTMKPRLQWLLILGCPGHHSSFRHSADIQGLPLAGPVSCLHAACLLHTTAWVFIGCALPMFMLMLMLMFMLMLMLLLMLMLVLMHMPCHDRAPPVLMGDVCFVLGRLRTHLLRRSLIWHHNDFTVSRAHVSMNSACVTNLSAC